MMMICIKVIILTSYCVLEKSKDFSNRDRIISFESVIESFKPLV